MQIGMIGLGRMGANMVRRLMRAQHECVVYDAHAEPRQALAREGAKDAPSLKAFVEKLAKPRLVWLMVPAAAVDPALTELTALLDPGDIVVDGGNSYYRDDIRRATECGQRKIHYLDVGVSGGVFGLERGFCLMIGGEDDMVARLDPIFKALCPGTAAATRTPGLGAQVRNAEYGYLHCGPHGAGHFVKMIHNGIEYGMMAAFAEGLNILHGANIGKRRDQVDAETTPLREPQYYQYDLDLADITEVWRRGSVIESWLLDLTAQALRADPELAPYAGRVSDSGEGRWTVLAAIDEGVPAPVISSALYARFSSRGDAGFANQILSAMRHAFGGHLEKSASQDSH